MMQFEAITELTDAQIGDLHQMYQGQWWSKGRNCDSIRQMLQQTDIIVAFCEAQHQTLAAFARVLSDGQYRAIILDVMVAEAYRRQGLGRKLMEAIAQHPELVNVELQILFCLPDLIPFYETLGFVASSSGTMMVRAANHQPSALDGWQR